MSKSKMKRGGIANWALYQSGEILSVINPNIDRRAGIKGTTEEMASAAICSRPAPSPP